MAYRHHLPLTLLLTAVLASCGQPPSETAAPQDGRQVNAQGAWHLAPLTAEEREADDFDSQLARLAETHPNFAGYTLDSDGAITLRLVKHGGDLPGQRVGQIAQALKALLDNNPRASVRYDDDGRIIPVKRVKPEFVTVKHNFTALYKAKIKARSELLRTGLAVSSYISDADGVLVLSARNPQALETLRAKVKELGYPDDLVRFDIIDAGPELSLRANFPYPIGGIRISGSPDPTVNYKLCSIGTNVRFTGTANGLTNPQGFLTARHCTPTVGAYDNFVFYQVGTRIGKEAIDPRPILQTTPGCAGNESGQVSQCVRADVVFATYEVDSNIGRIARPFESVNQDDVTVVNGVPNAYTVTAVASRPAVNSIVTKVGATTGWTKGKVVDDHTDFAVDNPNVGTYVVLDSVQVGRLNPTDTYQLSAGGDSGTAWFIRNALNVNDYNVQLAGIHFAGNSSSASWFSPVENIRQDYAGLGSFTFCTTGGPCN